MLPFLLQPQGFVQKGKNAGLIDVWIDVAWDLRSQFTLCLMSAFTLALTTKAASAIIHETFDTYFMLSSRKMTREPDSTCGPSLLGRPIMTAGRSARHWQLSPRAKSTNEKRQSSTSCTTTSEVSGYFSDVILCAPAD